MNKKDHDKASDDAFLSQISRLDPEIVPEADANDLQRGAGFIPEKVTRARRQGQEVKFFPRGNHPEN